MTKPPTKRREVEWVIRVAYKPDPARAAAALVLLFQHTPHPQEGEKQGGAVQSG